MLFIYHRDKIVSAIDSYLVRLFIWVSVIKHTFKAVQFCYLFQTADFSFIEMNASDARNKKILEQVVSESLNNTTMDGLLNGMFIFHVHVLGPLCCICMDY